MEANRENSVCLRTLQTAHSGVKVRLWFPKWQTADITLAITVSQVERRLSKAIVGSRACHEFICSTPHTHHQAVYLRSLILTESDVHKSRMQGEKKGTSPKQPNGYLFTQNVIKDVQEMLFFCLYPWSQIVWVGKMTPRVGISERRDAQRLKFPKFVTRTQTSKQHDGQTTVRYATRNVALVVFFCHRKAILTLPCVGFCQMSIWVLDNEPQQHNNNRLASKRHSTVTSVLDLHFDIPIPRVARAIRRSDAFRHHDAVIQPNRTKVKKVNRLTSQKVPAGGDSTVRQLSDLSSALKGDCDSSLSLSIVTQTISCHEVPFGLTCGQSSSCFESSLVLSLLDRASANNVVLYLFKVFLPWFTLLSSIQA